ncbi:MAG: UDP-3-O-(3-hydroxymyristoyl) glucosamine N-acyltransferase [Rhodospirillaceae bacterium BRH_c57]|nr:MAG: UDP-3-O-(3-hydroxymyristoyl) glucosamine N-acyltransferase [Rhodospirillaceae bacterium BRH_c57]
MADPRFFERAGPFALGALAEAVGGALHNGSAEAVVSDVASLQVGGPGDLVYVNGKQYLERLASSDAAACLLRAEFVEHAPDGMALIAVHDPHRAFAVIAALFYPEPKAVAGVHPTAVVDPTADIGEGVQIDAGAVIGANVSLGAGCIIGPNAVIGHGVVLGEDSIVGAGATISHAVIGRQARLYPGCRIGQDGFGFASGPRGHLRVPQLGRVLIGDDVEVGANTTIDRGAAQDTVIGSGCRIDNLVQIGHNVQIGAGSVVVAQVGISGSCSLGRGVVLGGQVGMADHLTVGDGAQIGAQSGVVRDVPAGSTVMGSPAKPVKEYWREVATLKKLASRPPR